MKPLLIILNPRNIAPCVDALQKLQIDKVWLKNWTERELVSVVADVIAECDHDVIGITSDDAILEQKTVDLILDAFEPSSVYAGYCNMHNETDDVNLSSKPIVVQSQASEDCYTYPKKTDVDSHEGLFRSWFTGGPFFMSREMWLKYPFDTIGDPGVQCDYSWSVRFQKDDVPIFAVPGAFMEHLKGGHGSTRHLPGGELVVGNGQGSVLWDLM